MRHPSLQSPRLVAGLLYVTKRVPLHELSLRRSPPASRTSISSWSSEVTSGKVKHWHHLGLRPPSVWVLLREDRLPIFKTA